MVIDATKLTHWMNARKLTPGAVADRSGVDLDELLALLAETDRPVAAADADKLAAALDVAAHQLSAAPAAPAAIVWSAAEIAATCRGIERDGIHFYNYYSLPCPHGEVGPVLLDILCPASRVPALNNGHLEPAITLNLGPGDINGRWSEELSGPGWQVLAANRSAEDGWIVGDSYVEPSYCPHSYSLAGDEPARIVSYTGSSNLASLVERANSWPAAAFETFAAAASRADATGAALLRMALERRGWEPAEVAARAAVDPRRLEHHLDGGDAALASDELRRIGDVLGADHRHFLPAPERHDALGKTYCSIDASGRSARRFRSYTVASMASSPRLPDLVGIFIRVEKSPAGEAELDLADDGDSHVLVTGGELELCWSDEGTTRRRTLGTGDCAWIGPFVPHALYGRGSALKLGHAGRGLSALDQAELTRTFDARHTLARAWRDRSGWGYDSGGAT